MARFFAPVPFFGLVCSGRLGGLFLGAAGRGCWPPEPRAPLFFLGIAWFETIDDNWLSIPYSLYMSLWSVLLLNFWVRRENELQFLWGTEELETTEEPRTNFKGILKVNRETEREQLVHPSQAIRAVRLGIGLLFCLTLVFATGALPATATWTTSPVPTTIDAT